MKTNSDKQSIDFLAVALDLRKDHDQYYEFIIWLPKPLANFAHILEEIKPYQTSNRDKKQEVEAMFDNISGKYDLLNRVLSLGIDISWRKKALRMLKEYAPQRILDIATGTGDLAFLAAEIVQPSEIIGVDLSQGMLDVAQKRYEQKKKQLKSDIRFLKGDAEDLQFPTGHFNGAMVAFGVRNFGDLEKGLAELNRILAPGAPIVILEFTKPRVFPFRQLYHIYFKHVLPLIGAWTSGDKRAYTYLFESVQAFPDFERFTGLMKEAGFERSVYKSLSLGICAIYMGFKSGS